jgi:hypothetical protein
MMDHIGKRLLTIEAGRVACSNDSDAAVLSVSFSSETRDNESDRSRQAFSLDELSMLLRPSASALEDLVLQV